MSKWTKEELAIMERALPIIDAVPAEQDQCWPGDAVIHDDACRLSDHDAAFKAVTATEGLSWDFIGWGNAAAGFRYRIAQAAEAAEESEVDEPSHDDTVHCCPDCETPNQFGELCGSCQRERDALEESSLHA